MITLSRRILHSTIVCAVFLAADAASAHPHVWITMKTEVIYAPDGAVKGVRHAWEFDDMFSVFATQGIKSRKRGEFTREELMPLRADQCRIAQGVRLFHVRQSQRQEERTRRTDRLLP